MKFRIAKKITFAAMYWDQDSDRLSRRGYSARRHDEKRATDIVWRRWGDGLASRKLGQRIGRDLA